MAKGDRHLARRRFRHRECGYARSQSPFAAGSYLLYQLALLKEHVGASDEADVLHREALDIRRAVLPPRHPDLARSLLAYGALLADAGRPAEVEPLLREACAIRAQNLPAGHWRRAEADNALGACWVAAGRFAEAEPLLQQSLTAIQQARGPSDPATRQAVSRLIRLYDASDRPSEAAAYRAALTAAP